MDKINLQLYSFGMESGLDLPARIKIAGEIGYSGVEFAGGYDGISADALSAMLAQAGLTAESAHVGLSAMEQDIPYLAKVGVRRIICPMESFATAQEAKEVAQDLNRFGKLAADYGMKTGYHNHTNEFYQVDGVYLYDLLMDACDPQYVEFELDCGWASAAGVDPVAYINAHKGQICAIHIKENGGVIGADKPKSRHDITPDPSFDKDENGKPIFPPDIAKMLEARERLNVPTGTGIVDWKAVKAAADAQMDNVIYVIEREVSYGGKDRTACLREDLAWVRENL